MRERLDCAVLLTRCTFDWMQPFLGPHAGGRLHMHAFETVVDIEEPDAPAVLGAAAMALRRYDACLIPVRPATLSWARTSLSLAMSQVQTPVMALTKELTTAGLYDLHQLGVADFLRDPFCGHEARMRVERLLDGRRGLQANSPVAPHHVSDGAADTASYGADHLLEKMCRNILHHDGAEIDAYATMAASRCAGSSESFHDAKSKVVGHFERAYITASLRRHGGNIAMAARAAQKHRRAFWAIMRKHDIAAEPFREQTRALPRSKQPACPSIAKGVARVRRQAHFPGGQNRPRPLPER